MLDAIVNIGFLKNDFKLTHSATEASTSTPKPNSLRNIELGVEVLKIRIIGCVDSDVHKVL